jgi:hypothetical protein
MENFFRPGKWFVLFCGVFVLIYAALQYVSNSRLKTEAQIVGSHIFTWKWPGSACLSQAEITDAQILRKTESDAVVQVKGKQSLLNDSAKGTANEECTAILTFYKRSIHNQDYWELGQVQFP